MFKLTFSTANAAFDDDCGGRETAAAILREIADTLEDGLRRGAVRDLNGNSIGEWELPELRS